MKEAAAQGDPIELEGSSLREPGSVLLISCYELGHQPIGVAQPIGFLRQAGFSPGAMDIAVEEFDEQLVRAASFVGISVPMHTALRLGLRVAELIRSIHPACHVCFYGLYASLNTDYLLETVADSVIGGEYEVPMVQLVQALDRERSATDSTRSLPSLAGVSLRGRTARPNLDRPPTASPVPNRAGLPSLERYARLEHDGESRLVGYVEASRGCLHTCLHCPIVPVYQGRFFVFPEKVVLEDIRAQVLAGARHITFGDPDFLNGPGHVLKIVRALHEEFPDVTFDCTTKIEHILQHRALFPDLAASGCLFVISAVESFSDHVLAQLAKGHTRADIITALQIAGASGITLRPSLVAFTPWTTLDDYLEMFDLVEQNELVEAIDPVQYTVRLLIPPGSSLLTQAQTQPTPVQEFVTSLDQANFQYRWIHPDPRMDQLHQAVTGIVEEAAKAELEPEATFDALRARAHQIAGRPESPRSRGSAAGRPKKRPPRLTEPWFCCAEPTKGQLYPLQTKGSGEV